MTENDLAQRLRGRAYSGLPDPLSEQAANEIERLRLTDAERAAAAFFSQIDGPGNVPVANHHATTLRGLLERISSTEAERSPDKLSPQT
jgi:hypothetical protein